MANVDAPFGFRPISNEGGLYNGATRRCQIPATAATAAVFVGDAVKLDTESAATGGYQSVDIATGGNPVYGVVTSFEADPSDLEAQYRKASTLRFCQVALAENNLFVVQDAAILGLAAIGANAAFTKVAGSTVTGFSKSEMGATGTATDDALQVVGGYDAPDNDMTLSNALFVVKFNNTQSKVGRAGI